ncbi:hypothetical protein GCM10023084_54960 [Streptomyces lacrimifluminis]|uniref:Uncharacterized protein n=1 Tax=Streptomyces lacrimifluminis TaxID=1500077 RepID=A0A917KYR3_9ACTN|nr:hypothetical protein [Streptomyces lacrimifluminis]GGJ33611.1 hypothetical protein GCM10012282_32900 [Streptomyces lacrimifluminis]
MDKFLARSARYQSLMRAEPTSLDLAPARVVDAGAGRSVEAVAEAVLNVLNR